jgi:predicted GNAT family acetyltransferase
MKLTTYTNADLFLKDVQPELEKHEAEHSLILGLALAARSNAPSANSIPFFATIRDTRQLLVAAYMTYPNPLVLSALQPAVEKALEFIIDHLQSSRIEVSGIVAPKIIAETLAEYWSRSSRQTAEIDMRQRLYKLTSVRDAPVCDGELRRASDSDLDVVSRWVASSDAEALHEDIPEKAWNIAKQRIERGEIYLWEDTEPRCMAAKTRPTAHGIAINSVYTPPEWRRQGYATACVARLSERLLQSGYSFCVLFTDLANPTSNSIYTCIGYKPVCDFVKYNFRRNFV